MPVANIGAEETPPTPTVAQKTKGAHETRTDPWKTRIQQCKNYKRQLIREWGLNVDYRRGKQFDTDSDVDRIAVTDDWARTKAKQAQLFSQVPEVRLTPKKPKYRSAVPTWAAKLNEVICEARVGVAMDECLPDVINAAGVAAVVVGYERRTEQVSLPTVDPAQADMLVHAGLPVPTAMQERTSDARYTCKRVSPADLLWDVSFAGSDFDDGPFAGYTGRLPWNDAKVRFKLVDADKESCAQSDSRGPDASITHGQEEGKYKETEIVEYDELFYWRYLFYAEETNFDAIQHLVYVRGKDAPVIDELWKGQKRPSMPGPMLGARKFPVRFLTLTYLTDECIPPSDSAVGRPQVNERIRSRSNMADQREHSRPIRWFDVNRTAPEVQDTLIRGTWQGMIPMNGDGSRAIGEVARAAYPSENFAIDNVINNDLDESWQTGSNQMGGQARRGQSAAEAKITQANFSTRIAYERARCERFLVGIAEILAGFLSLFGTFDEEEAQALSVWNREELANYYVYNVRADSTVLLDSNQRMVALTEFLNLTAKSGFVNVKPVIEELAMLAGLNADTVVVDPEPPGLDPANVSVRITGMEDLSNPLVLALLKKSGQLPSVEDIEEAKKLLALAAPVPAVTKDPTVAMTQANQDRVLQESTPAPAAPLVPDNPSPDWNLPERVNTRSIPNGA